METSAAKRRKLSPRAAVAVDHQPESTTPGNSPPERITRASYASPTKSSLSRHNPDILSRRKPPVRRSHAADAGRDNTVVPPLGSDDEQLRGNQRASTLQRSMEDDAQPENATDKLSRSPARRLGGSMASRPRRSPAKPTPRPLPARGPEDDEEIIDPFMRRGLRRSPTGVHSEAAVPEPELPPTPQHLDQVASTPPMGIHNTPSKRPRRSKALAEKIKSSPTKLLASKLAGAPGSASRRTGAALAHDLSGEDELAADVSSIRGVEPLDRNAAKKRRRDSLLAEISQLEADLDVVAEENERVRQSRHAKSEVTAPSNNRDILDVIRRHIVPDRSADEAHPSTTWVQAALNPIAFLPFGKPSSSLPTLFPDQTTEPESEESLTSHHPIPMSAEEALPYLQVFTPLTFTSTISLLPVDGDDDSAPLLQRHSVTVSSASPPGLFSARIEMTVDTTTHVITDLTVPHLDPAAAAELNPVIETVAANSSSSSSSATGNVTVLTWAMAEWLRLSVRRAGAWRTLDRELGTKEGMAESVQKLRAAGRKTRRKGKARAGGDSEDRTLDSDPLSTQDDSSVEDIMGSLVGTTDLLPFMGQRSMDFQVPALEGDDAEVSNLRVQWRIEFDWTGEGRSRIGLLVGTPGKCKFRKSLPSL